MGVEGWERCTSPDQIAGVMSNNTRKRPLCNMQIVKAFLLAHLHILASVVSFCRNILQYIQ